VRALVLGIANLGERGLPGAFSTECRDGACCEQFRADLVRELDPAVRLTAFYSRSDAIVHWQACLDPSGKHVEVDSSHCGMSVNVEVYRGLVRILGDGDAMTDPGVDPPEGDR
jgi:triacylglycerol lipase